MSLRVIGAGLGRTGTNSLKLALERLLDGPCYHMLELFEHPEHIPVWEGAVRGDEVNWQALFSGYRATVDWTGAAFFSELASAYPGAIVLLSVRDPDEWWRSYHRTIVATHDDGLDQREPSTSALTRARQLSADLLRSRFTPGWREEAAAKAAFVRHNDAVRSLIASERLIEWHPGDGWSPICSRLGLPVPSEEFPHLNTTDDFRAMSGLDRS